MGLLDGKRILVTGVLMDTSIAFHVARIAQQEGAEVVLTSFGRTMRITQTIAKRLPTTPPVIELDVSKRRGLRPARPSACVSTSTASTGCCTRSASPRRRRWAATSSRPSGPTSPPPCRSRPSASRRSRSPPQPLMPNGGSVVGLTFDATVAWPKYDWMGVAKAAFESTARYLARDLGPVGDPGQPRRGRTAEDHGGQGDPRLRGVRGRLGPACAAALGRHRLRAGRPRLRRAAVGLVPAHHRGDRARRRRRARHGRLTGPAMAAESEATGGPSLVELRVLDGANLYFPRPAVKLTLDLSGLLALDEDQARAVAAAARHARRPPGAARTRGCGSASPPRSSRASYVAWRPRRARRGWPCAAGRPPTCTGSSSPSRGGDAARPRRSVAASPTCSTR